MEQKEKRILVSLEALVRLVFLLLLEVENPPWFSRVEEKNEA